MIATPMGNNGTLPKIHSPTAHVCCAAAVFNSRCVRRGIRDVPTARLCPRCANYTRADTHGNPYASSDNHMDIYKYGNKYYDPFGNIVAYIHANGNIVATHPRYNKYFYTNADANQHDSSGTQPDADAPVKRSERGGLGENDADS